MDDQIKRVVAEFFMFEPRRPQIDLVEDLQLDLGLSPADATRVLVGLIADEHVKVVQMHDLQAQAGRAVIQAWIQAGPNYASLADSVT
jgi:hypothetical protein